jgi:hypothetical protein
MGSKFINGSYQTQVAKTNLESIEEQSSRLFLQIHAINNLTEITS